MDEKAWLTSTDPQAMLEFLQTSGKASQRKLRLFACACGRRVWHLFADEEIRNALEVAERFADGLATEEERQAAGEIAWRGVGADNVNEEWCRHYEATVSAGHAASVDAFDAAYFTHSYVRSAVKVEIDGVVGDYGECSKDAQAAGRNEAAAQAACIRDIFGNPFRPPPPIPASVLTWHHGLVRRLAEEAYQHRQLPSGQLDTDRLAVLADALLEAGCDDADIIGHLRRPGAAHVRGCFAVDLLLAPNGFSGHNA